MTRLIIKDMYVGPEPTGILFAGTCKLLRLWFILQVQLPEVRTIRKERRKKKIVSVYPVFNYVIYRGRWRMKISLHVISWCKYLLYDFVVSNCFVYVTMMSDVSELSNMSATKRSVKEKPQNKDKRTQLYIQLFSD